MIVGKTLPINLLSFFFVDVSILKYSWNNGKPKKNMRFKTTKITVTKRNSKQKIILFLSNI